eukprot:m.80402 g.80402  ORF g.80402 m.80402 type:complete len:50 (+) comp8038_c0_seq2:28-177(+)
MVEVHEAPSVSGTVLILGAIVGFHVAAFMYWIYLYTTTSDKPRIDFKRK